MPKSVISNVLYAKVHGEAHSKHVAYQQKVSVTKRVVCTWNSAQSVLGSMLQRKFLISRNST